MTEQEQAVGADSEINHLVNEIANGETIVTHTYVDLAVQLLEIRERAYWKHIGFKTFGAYRDQVCRGLGKSKSTLYGYIGVVERLLPVISRPQLKSIGIGKAVELGKIEKKTGLVPDSAIIELALKPETTVEALKEAIHDRYKTGKEEAGKYYEFGGFRINPDEEAEITYGLELVTKQAGLENLPTNIQRKEQFLALLREFTGTYGEGEENEGNI